MVLGAICVDIDPNIFCNDSSLWGVAEGYPSRQKTSVTLKKSVLKTTGFFGGLFEGDELISDNVKDRESKILFLNKVVYVLGFASGKSLSVKSTKIVAGQEPEKTNELLQCLAQTLDKKISSDEAVKKYKENVNTAQLIDKKTKEPTKSTKKNNDTKKLTSKSTEKLTSNKRDANEKTQTKNEKEKVTDNKLRKKENTTVKSENSKKTQQIKSLPKKSSNENKSKPNEENSTQNKNLIVQNNGKRQEGEPTLNSEKQEGADNILRMQDNKDTAITEQLITSKVSEDEQGHFDTSFTIAENDLNASLSSQDLMETENLKPEVDKNDSINADLNTEDIPINHKAINDMDQFINHNEDNHTINNIQLGVNKLNKLMRSSANNDNSELDTSLKSIDKVNSPDNVTNPISTLRNNATVTRPLSVRPSSSRPGAPRLREKLDNTVPESDNIILGKVNIIEENPRNEDDEDNSIIIVEQPDSSTISQEQQLQLASNDHGHLVQQILDSQKEFSQVIGKTEIEWQFGAVKAKEALNQEIEQLRFNIQALSRVANPLGKLLDHVQEDVEVMRQELQQWSNIYEEVSKEMLKQKTVNENSLLPLHAKLKQLNADIEDKHDKIDDLKILIHKNSSRIEKLLVNSGNVQ